MGRGAPVCVRPLRDGRRADTQVGPYPFEPAGRKQSVNFGSPKGGGFARTETHIYIHTLEDHYECH